MLTAENFASAVQAHCWRRLVFSDSTTVWQEKDESFIVVPKGTRDEAAYIRCTTVEEAMQAVEGLTPLCAWCFSRADEQPAVAIMADGLLVCAECQPKVAKYYECNVCKKALSVSLASSRRRRFEEGTCMDKACQRAEDIKYGRLCCDQAEYIPCVCHRSYKCLVHYPTGVHIGTHD